MTITNINTTPAAELDETRKAARVHGVENIAWLLGVASAASTDTTLPVLCHIRLISDGHTVWAQGTDRYVLASASVPADKDGAPFDILIPAKWAIATAKECAKRHRPDDAILSIDGDRATFSVGDTLTATRDATLGALFPSVGSLLSGAGDDTGSFVFDPSLMGKALTVASTCARRAKGMEPRWTVKNRSGSARMYGTVSGGSRSLALLLMGIRYSDGHADTGVLAAHREAPQPARR